MSLSADDALTLAKLLAVLVAFLVAVWRMGSRLEKMRLQSETHSTVIRAEMQAQTTVMDTRLSGMKEAIEHSAEITRGELQRVADRVERTEDAAEHSCARRKEIWCELHNVRDRTLALETQAEVIGK